MTDLRTYSVLKGTIQAKPMTRGEYAFGVKGQTTLYGGEEDDAGYFIQYENGLTGWMPAADFADNYHEAETWQQRLVTERNELNERCTRLAAFTASEVFSAMSEDDREALTAQQGIQETLLAVLNIRVDNAFPQEY